MRFIILLLLIPFCAFNNTFGQSIEEKVEEKVSALEITNATPKINAPTKAALLSAVFPGLGQVYNKKYWKLPIIYGGAVAFGAVIRFNQNQYTTFKNELIRHADGDPSTVPINSAFSESSLKSIRDNARKNRDYSIILAIAFYALNIADAAVDAHLKDFDIDDDLSLQVYPSLNTSVDGKPVPSLTMSFQF